MDMDWDMKVPSSPSSMLLFQDAAAPCRYIVTLVKKPELSVSCLHATFLHCSQMEAECIRLDRLSWHGDFSAMRISVLVPYGAEAELRDRLVSASQSHEVDIAFQ